MAELGLKGSVLEPLQFLVNCHSIIDDDGLLNRKLDFSTAWLHNVIMIPVSCLGFEAKWMVNW